jgi:hypothetical protein
LPNDVLGKALYEAIDEAFATLGKSAKMMLCRHIERRTPETIFDRVDIVTETLELFLGRGGKSLSKLIAKYLYRKLGLDFQTRNDWDLAQYVGDARSKIERMQQKLMESQRVIASIASIG